MGLYSAGWAWIETTMGTDPAPGIRGQFDDEDYSNLIIYTRSNEDDGLGKKERKYMKLQSWEIKSAIGSRQKQQVHMNYFHILIGDVRISFKHIQSWLWKKQNRTVLVSFFGSNNVVSEEACKHILVKARSWIQKVFDSIFLLSMEKSCKNIKLLGSIGVSVSRDACLILDKSSI